MAVTDYDPLFEKYGKAHNVDPALLRAIATQESGGNPKAVSNQGARGLMQIMPATAKRLGVQDAFDPDQAVQGAAKLISESLERNGNVADAISEYHGGPDRKIWGPKNRRYREEVMARYSGAQGAPSVAGSDADDILFGDAPSAAAPKSAVDDVLFGDAPPSAPVAEGMAATELADEPQLTGRGEVSYAGLKDKLSKPQQDLLSRMDKIGQRNKDAAAGSVYNPFFIQPGMTEADAQKIPGAYYVTEAGTLGRAPGGEKDTPNIGEGFMRGVGDVGLTGLKVLQGIPGVGESGWPIKADLDRMAYDANNPNGNVGAGIGRFTGQVVGALPAMGAAELAAAPVLANMGGVGAFLAGKGGQVLTKEGLKMAPGLGGLLTRGGSLAAQGAGQGALGAGLVSSTSDAPVGEQMARGAVAGAALGPLLPAVGGVAKGIGSAAKGLVEPLSGGGQEKIVNRLLGEFPADTLDMRELVPGSIPTLGEASGSAGLAALERNARTNPKLADRFAERMQQNSNARTDFFNRVKGDSDTIEALQDARDAATTALREKAFEGAPTANPLGAVEKIDEILAGPHGQRDAVVKALTTIRGKLAPDTGGLQGNVEQLYGIRKAIGDMLDPLGPQETKSAILAKGQLMEVRKAIDGAIEDAAPGFRKYLKTHADMSKPVDEAQFLQSLNMTDTKGNITLAKVQAALDKIEKMKSQPGVNKAKSISAETIGDLKALRDDLKRAGNIDLGKARGSDTTQNLVTGKFASDLSVPLALGAGAALNHPLVAPAVGIGKLFYKGKEGEVLDKLAGRLLYPGTPVAAAKTVAKKGPNLGQRLLSPSLPGTAGILSNRLVGGQ